MTRDALSNEKARERLLVWFAAALDAVDPAHCLAGRLPREPAGRTLVVGAGKAAAKMARAVEAGWSGPLSGVVVVPPGHSLPCRRIEVIEAAHPLPDESSERAARRLLEAVRGVSPDDLVLGLLSGGGSALLALPTPGLSLADKRCVTESLLAAGASIREINCVRTHLSAIKGGRLGLACAPSRLALRLISDVPGDDPQTVASGPFHPDPSTFADARAVLKTYRIAAPASVVERFARGEGETLKPNDPRLAEIDCEIVAAARDALAAAAVAARAEGVRPVLLGDDLKGCSRALARSHAERARRLSASGSAVEAAAGDEAAPPCVLLSGGETTVRVRGAGIGGRNSEYLLALALALDGMAGVFALAADTDGIDGNGIAAGALLFPDTLTRAAALGLDARAALSANDSQGFFCRLGDLLVTEPTRTNVNDFRAILIDEAN